MHLTGKAIYMKQVTLDNTHPDFAKAETFMNAWQAGHEWAHNLKKGDNFLGAWGEAKARYTDEYAISAFTSAGYKALQTMRLWVSDAGLITRIESK